MLVHKHVILGAFFSILIYPLVGFYSIIVFLSSFLIDVDHYIYYVYKTGNFNLWKSVDYFLEKERNAIMIFHTVEFLSLLIITSLLWYIVIYILLGVSFHLILDIYHSLHKNQFSVKKYFIFT